MAFFDEFKRGASEVADKVAKKTTDLTAIAKIAFNIKSDESKLSNVYEEIGYLFYTAERNGVDYTEEISAQILKADGLLAEIETLKKESAKLRNSAVCSACGNEIACDVAFCPFCGKKQEEAHEDCGCCECNSEEADEEQ